mgnify:CR=1 FL=1
MIVRTLSLSLLLARCGTEETAQATLKAYQALTEDDPDKNIQLLRR